MKVGDKISNYLILSFSHRIGKNSYYSCKCINCGTINNVSASNLRQKKSNRGYCKSCNTDKHYLYSTWKSMICRCYNTKSTGYSNYGGRGIAVCDSWRESFWNFYEDMGDRPYSTTLDRINNYGNYSKENCRWADSKQQSRNTRRNLKIPYQGAYVTEADLAAMTGVSRTSIQARRLKGSVTGEEMTFGLG